MKVNIRTLHDKVDREVLEVAEQKALKLDRFFEGILHVDIVLDRSGSQNEAEMIAVLPRHVRLVGKGQAMDMQTAVDEAEDKLKKQIRRFHDKLRGHRDRSRAGSAAAIEDTESGE